MPDVLTEHERTFDIARNSKTIYTSEINSQLGQNAVPPRSVAEKANFVAEVWKVEHAAIRKVMTRSLDECPVDLIHMHGCDFSDYMPSRDVPVPVNTDHPRFEADPFGLSAAPTEEPGEQHPDAKRDR